MRVGQWMTITELNSFRATGVIPRSNVLGVNCLGYRDQAAHRDCFVIFDIDIQYLKLKDQNRHWYIVKPISPLYRRLYERRNQPIPNIVIATITHVCSKVQ